jgi:hypothetical protein
MIKTSNRNFASSPEEPQYARVACRAYCQSTGVTIARTSGGVFRSLYNSSVTSDGYVLDGRNMRTTPSAGYIQAPTIKVGSGSEPETHAPSGSTWSLMRGTWGLIRTLSTAGRKELTTSIIFFGSVFSFHAINEDFFKWKSNYILSFL